MYDAEGVLRRLEAMGIPFHYITHEAAFTVAEMQALVPTPCGQGCKNLFLKDDKGRAHYLVSLCEDKRVDLAALQRQLGSRRLGFASEGRLTQYLGLSKGAVTPLGLLNDTDGAVQLVMDRELAGRTIAIHPNINIASVCLACEDLLRLLAESGHQPVWVDI